VAVETVQKFYGLFAEGDVPSAFALLDPQVEWTEAAQGPYEGTFRGVPAVVSQVFERLGADFENFAAEPEEFVGQGDRVAVFGTYSGKVRSTGRELKAPFVHSWTVHDGRLSRFVRYTDTGLWNEALR
jgi:ketosteroid isomerase-like protein